MVPKKHKSKRLSLKQQKKIHTRATEKHRKDRREARKNPQRKKLNKDPGIPNLLPFKDKVLKEIEDHREAVKEEKQRQRDARGQVHNNNRQLDILPKTMADLAKDAQKRDAAYDLEHDDSDSDMDTQEISEGAISGRRDNSKRAYYREFQKVVQHADVILEVLDARDPLGTRAPQIERMILDAGANKRIILILNKIDLVPRSVVEKWLAYLRHEFPTLAFKASTQEQRRNLGQASSVSKKAVTLSTSECVGAESLIQLLKNYSRNQKIKTSITVGIIGFPNVGKSSLINSLKRSRVCGVGSTPGFTKFVQQIQLDSKLKLLDCPGIVFNHPTKAQKMDKTAAAEMMLRNCIKVELLEDPIAPVDLIVQRCNPNSLQVMYNVPAFSGTRDFLVRLARQRGMLMRQGIADLASAARVVLNDWNGGKIPYYTLPPGMSQDTASGKTAAGDAAAAHGAERAVVVSQWSKEFDIDALLGDIDSQALAGANNDAASSRRAMVMEGRTVVQDAEMQMQIEAGGEDSDSELDSDDDAMDEDADEVADEAAGPAASSYIVDLPQTRKTKAKETSQSSTNVTVIQTVSSSRNINAEQRKLKKKQAKLEARALANAANDMMADESDDGDDSYDFGTYFKQPDANGQAAAESDSDEDL
ncbi:nuclear GTP-binding protein nug1 [Coemansia sp. RSA 1722]|nr:nuclear GTP-binding protein nug1 [Coemansia sp. RSA 485]KAJ2606631.1 nuclear GTP-binding protein nug1 [Coemansia sp. RSA 1722]